MHKEIGDAVAKLYTQARDAGALPRILERAGVQRETVQVQGRFQIESGSCLGLKFWPHVLEREGRTCCSWYW